MSALRAVVAEDEPVLRSELKEMLAKLWPELVICAEAGDGIEALQALSKHVPNIMFLDIQMPGHLKAPDSRRRVRYYRQAWHVTG